MIYPLIGTLLVDKAMKLPGDIEKKGTRIDRRRKSTLKSFHSSLLRGRHNYRFLISRLKCKYLLTRRGRGGREESGLQLWVGREATRDGEREGGGGIKSVMPT